MSNMFDIFRLHDPAHDSIKVMTLRVSNGLEFPVVALVGAGRMPAEGEDEREEARRFYVGATRATQRLVIGASGRTSAGLQHPAQGADFLPEHSSRHRHGHGLHAPIQPAMTLLQAVNRLAQVARHGRSIGLCGLGQCRSQQRQAQVHHRQVDHIAAEHAIVCMTV